MNSFERPPFLLSVFRWLLSGINSSVHFIFLLLVSTFSHLVAWAIYKHWGKIAYKIFDVTLSIRDDNKGNHIEKPYLYIWLNQSNLAEIFILPQLLPPHFGIANIEYAAMPLVGWALWPLRYLVVIRQWKRQAKKQIEKAAARIEKGELCAISIEGARSKDGRLLPYKKGPIVLALKSKATIIPMVMHGGHEVMPLGDWRVKPGHIELHLLKAIPTHDLTYDDRNIVVSKLRALAEHELSLKN